MRDIIIIIKKEEEGPTEKAGAFAAAFACVMEWLRIKKEGEASASMHARFHSKFERNQSAAP